MDAAVYPLESTDRGRRQSVRACALGCHRATRSTVQMFPNESAYEVNMRKRSPIPATAVIAALLAGCTADNEPDEAAQAVDDQRDDNGDDEPVIEPPEPADGADDPEPTGVDPEELIADGSFDLAGTDCDPSGLPTPDFEGEYGTSTVDLVGGEFTVPSEDVGMPATGQIVVAGDGDVTGDGGDDVVLAIDCLQGDVDASTWSLVAYTEGDGGDVQQVGEAASGLVGFDGEPPRQVDIDDGTITFTDPDGNEQQREYVDGEFISVGQDQGKEQIEPGVLFDADGWTTSQGELLGESATVLTSEAGQEITLAAADVPTRDRALDVEAGFRGSDARDVDVEVDGADEVFALEVGGDAEQIAVLIAGDEAWSVLVWAEATDGQPPSAVEIGRLLEVDPTSR